ncbi:ImpA-related N-terminal family protein [Escherichia coli]|uniref:ImpA-related N-terminal family protein n=1 Tax=Escherichia coli TaxID=562 RepID=A0A376L5N6_ECOLX|nr:ImpA-related N-terminal family protein [Escherichia coli]
METLCLRLYEHNGVELQTASWYTIARMHTTGLSGLNEGLALIVALTRHHWSVMWPLNTHARLEIITGLFNRLQKTLRAMPPDNRDNLPLLYQTETLLKALSDTLARHELKQSSKVALPEAMVKGYITRLENQPVQGEVSSPVTLPAQALRSDAPDVQEHQTLPHSRLVYVVSETKAEPTPSLQKSPPTFLKQFVAGVCAALLTVSVAIPGWQFLTQSSPAEQQLRALLTPTTGCAFSRPDDTAQQNILIVKSCVRVDNPFRSADNAADTITPGIQPATQCAAAAATEGTFSRQSPCSGNGG